MIAQVLTEQYFGSADAMLRLDMSEYMERHSVAKLIGAPPGLSPDHLRVFCISGLLSTCAQANMTGVRIYCIAHSLYISSIQSTM